MSKDECLKNDEARMTKVGRRIRFPGRVCYVVSRWAAGREVRILTPGDVAKSGPRRLHIELTSIASRKPEFNYVFLFSGRDKAGCASDSILRTGRTPMPTEAD